MLWVYLHSTLYELIHRVCTAYDTSVFFFSHTENQQHHTIKHAFRACSPPTFIGVQPTVSLCSLVACGENMKKNTYAQARKYTPSPPPHTHTPSHPHHSLLLVSFSSFLPSSLLISLILPLQIPLALHHISLEKKYNVEQTYSKGHCQAQCIHFVPRNPKRYKSHVFVTRSNGRMEAKHAFSMNSLPKKPNLMNHTHTL